MINTIQKYIFQSLKGINKDENQDNYLIIQGANYSLYGVFDGVGSAVNSKRATLLAKAFIKKNFLKFISVNSLHLDKMMFECNVYILSLGIPETLSTYCLAYISNDKNEKMIYSSLGDSRIYLISDQYIQQITNDDKVFSSQNIITKCLGMDLAVSDFYQKSIERIEANVLICTDGFYTFLEGDRMLFFNIFSKKRLKSISITLKGLIYRNNKDDSTYLFVR